MHATTTDRPTTYSARDLLALRPGAMLLVRLLSGREVRARLQHSPSLSSSRKPGLGRVQLDVLDTAHASRIDAYWERQTPSSMWGRTVVLTFNKCMHTVSGDRVLAIL